MGFHGYHRGKFSVELISFVRSQDPPQDEQPKASQMERDPVLVQTMVPYSADICVWKDQMNDLRFFFPGKNTSIKSSFLLFGGIGSTSEREPSNWQNSKKLKELPRR